MGHTSSSLLLPVWDTFLISLSFTLWSSGSCPASFSSHPAHVPGVFGHRNVEAGVWPDGHSRGPRERAGSNQQPVGCVGSYTEGQAPGDSWGSALTRGHPAAWRAGHKLGNIKYHGRRGRPRKKGSFLFQYTSRHYSCIQNSAPQFHFALGLAAALAGELKILGMVKDPTLTLMLTD